MNNDAQGRWKVGMSNIKLKMRAQTVSLMGRAKIPTFFLGFFGYDSLDLATRSTAVRRDVNLMLVLDRSGSMVLAPSDSQGRRPFEALQDSAKLFLDKFDETRDKFGVVSFGTNARVDYPPQTDFKTPLNNLIDSLRSYSSNRTNSALAMCLAYNELKLLNDQGPFNVVVYFTDGQSTAFPGQFDVNTSGSRSCTFSPVDGVYMTNQTGSATWGLFQQQGVPPPGPNPDYVLLPDCSGMGRSGQNGRFLIISPFRDRWHPLGSGNPPAISIYNDAVNPGVNPALTSDGRTVIDIGDNMLVNGGSLARLDPNLPITIFAIGLGGYLGPAKHDVLRQMANADQFADPANGPTGVYVYAPGPDQLEQAFLDVAGEITRLIQ